MTFLNALEIDSGLVSRIDDIAPLDPVLELRDQGSMDPHNSMFLSLAHQMDLTEMEFDVFWTELHNSERRRPV